MKLLGIIFAFFVAASSFADDAKQVALPKGTEAKAPADGRPLQAGSSKTGTDLDEKIMQISLSAFAAFEKVRAEISALGPTDNPATVFPKYEALVLTNLAAYSAIWKTLAAAGQLKNRSLADKVQHCSTKLLVCMNESVDVATWFTLCTNQPEFRDFGLATVEMAQKLIAAERRLLQPQFLVNGRTVSDAAIKGIKIPNAASGAFAVAEECSALAQAALTNFAAIHESPKPQSGEPDNRFEPILNSFVQLRLKLGATIDGKSAKDFDHFVRIEIALTHIQCVAEYLALQLNDLSWVEIARDAMILRSKWGQTYMAIVKRLEETEKARKP